MTNDDKRPTGGFRWLPATVAFVVTAAVCLPLLYHVVVWLLPPITHDGKPLMPVAHVAFALVMAPMLAVLAGWAFGRPRS